MTESSEYMTLKATSEGIYREKMSKFIAIATPVSTVDEAKAFVDRTRNEYCDARHVCWAYMIGADRKTFQINDNGEPSGTAGKPILGQINSFGLTNVAVCVVRYFGGIKLGTSGLTAAYREATRIALSEAEIITRTEECDIELTFGYLSMNDVMKIVKNLDLKILEQHFDNTCRMTVSYRKDEAENLVVRFSAIEGVSARIRE